ncbi:MAG: zonular occludens toxin family protein [Haemophilus parainfluenzae]
MLYLITGKPGSGKTLHMISMLMHKKDLQGRPLYIDGIPDVDPVKIPYEMLPENCTGENWQEWLPSNAILVVDECQRYWRTRPNGSKVPEAVQALETHRHRGVDLFFITQHPRLIDVNIRSFVENHKHFDKTQLGTRRMWEWQRCGNPDSAADLEQAMVKPYKLDKTAFSAYKSAEVHTKIKVNRSKWVWLFPLLLMSTIAMTYYSYTYNKKILNEKPTALNQTNDIQAARSTAASEPTEQGQYSPNQTQPTDKDSVDVKVLKASDFIPSLEGKPWTAPVYAPYNTNIQTMPYPVACVKNGNRCTCYTDQATPIRGMDKGLCLDFVENGIYNPYYNSSVAQANATPTNQTNSLP